MEKENYSSEISPEELKKYIHEIFFDKKTERKVVGMRGCKTYGWVNMGGNWEEPTSCNDPECVSCQMWHEALAEEAKNFLK